MYKMATIKNDILEHYGNTPLIKLCFPEMPNIKLYAKLEWFNPTGSVKDRAAKHILNKLIADETIRQDTVIIESSSGNFGVSLAAYSKHLGIKFICVVDPKITRMNERLLNLYEAKIIKVAEPDAYGGYLIARLKRVKELVKEIPNSYWINQYENKENADAYYYSLGSEVCEQIPDLDYAFIGVGSGGTITGLSRRLKDHNPKIKVIAVDVYGSVIFGGKSSRRYIPGIGSSIKPKLLESACIDDVQMVSEADSIKECKRLIRENMILCGGSSGSVSAAVKSYFKDKKINKDIKALAIFADGGSKYLDTIYDDQWSKAISWNEPL